MKHGCSHRPALPSHYSVPHYSVMPFLRFASLLWCLIACIVVRGADDAPAYPEHQDLSYYLDAAGQKQPIKTKEDWRIRRGHLLTNLHKLMGDLPRSEK